MTSIKCPKCGLINPESAQICDCGYNFETHLSGIPVPDSRHYADREVFESADGRPYEMASLGQRLVGKLLDRILGIIPVLVVAVLSRFLAVSLGISELSITLMLAYILFADGFKGQSIAKRMLKIIGSSGFSVGDFHGF